MGNEGAQMSAIGSAEIERRAAMRRYFESGCLCVLSGKLDKAAAPADDGDAIAFYEARCRCSRNYVDLTRLPGSDGRIFKSTSGST